eukprot:scaffold83472_cov36-Phaeocystis_antarctica.AAC.2
MRQRLQPYAPEAATLRARGCNPMHTRLQPYAPEAATVRVQVRCSTHCCRRTAACGAASPRWMLSGWPK